MSKRCKSIFKKALSLGLVVAISASVMINPKTSAVNAMPPQSDAAYDGSDLWLRYVPVTDAVLLTEYKNIVKSVIIQETNAEDLYRFADTPLYKTYWPGSDGLQQPDDAEEVVPETRLEAARLELDRGLSGLFGMGVPIADAPNVTTDGTLIVGTPETSPIIAGLGLDAELAGLYGVASYGDDGYIIRSMKVNGFDATVIAANTEIGALYGTFAFLRLIQTYKSINDLDIVETPRVNHRRLNGWSRERLYAALTPEPGAQGDGSTGQLGDSIGDGTSNSASSTGGESGDIFNWDLTPSPSSGAAAHSGSGAVRLPIILDRYVVFARAAASLGINEININNVNSNPAYASEYVIRQEAALADALRPYGIKLAISVNYGFPTTAACNYAGITYPRDDTTVIGTSATAVTMDPNSEVYQGWWRDKAIQILKRIPDFAGFTIKANSEGQPGPQSYGYTHAEGSKGVANLLQNITVPADSDTLTQQRTGICIPVFWRSFVYNPEVDNDRLNRAYLEFGPGDDENAFTQNTFVQTKNGPLDFQPREPFHPMFGRMVNTNQALELQITKEYLGQNTSLCYLGPMYEEVFKVDTYANGEGTLLGNIVDGSAQGHTDTAIIGVHNLGNSPNFTGHHFDQSNFYVFGRLAWNWTLTSEEIAEEWTRMTWSNDDEVVEEVVDMMMGSHEAVTSYQEPFGLIHQMLGAGNHYDPRPWDLSSQDDWGPAYYNKVSVEGLGWDRTVAGRISDNFPEVDPTSKYYPLVNQYYPEVRDMWSNIDTCPEEYITTFHNVPWNRVMNSGRTFWEELVYRYQMGVQYVSANIARWSALQDRIDTRRWAEVNAKLCREEGDAARWRDQSVAYWKVNSMKDIPVDSAPLSIKLVIDGRTYDGFDLSDTVKSAIDGDTVLTGGNSPDNANYNNISVGIPSGGRFTIDNVIAYSPTAKVEITRQAKAYDEVAIVSVIDRCFFGEIRQDYRFRMVPDSDLKGIKINNQPLRGFTASQTAYSASVPSIPTITATAADPLANVIVTQATTLPGNASITVTSASGSNSKTYMIGIGRSGNASDEFDSTTLNSKWSWVREDTSSAGQWSLTGSALSLPISSGTIIDSGSLTEGTNRNMLLQTAPSGDYMIETKINTSSPLNANDQQVGIIARYDDANYFAVSMMATGASTGNIQVYRKQDGILTTFDFPEATKDNVARIDRQNIWLRLIKKGNDYMAGFSYDGRLWKSARIYTSNDVIAPINPTLDVVPTQVGIYTQNNLSLFSNIKANYDYFRVSPVGYDYSGVDGFGASIEGNNVITWFDSDESVGEGTFLVAVYKDDTLVEVKHKTFSINDDYYASFPLDMVKYRGNGYSIKAFAWDADYTPLEEAILLR